MENPFHTETRFYSPIRFCPYSNNEFISKFKPSTDRRSAKREEAEMKVEMIGEMVDTCTPLRCSGVASYCSRALSNEDYTEKMWVLINPTFILQNNQQTKDIIKVSFDLLF